MKKIITLFILILSIVGISCKKSEEPSPPVKENLLIEQYTYDSTGIIFKITNDVEHAWNYDANNFIGAIQKIDSIALGKFEYNGDSNDYFNKKHYTWFTKKGQYVYWKYKYLDGLKHLIVVFPNIYNVNNDPGKRYCDYETSLTCTTASSASSQIQLLFPIVNDTVVMHLTAINQNFVYYK